MITTFKSDELTIKLTGSEATLLLRIMDEAELTERQLDVLAGVERKLMQAERDQQSKPQPAKVSTKKAASKFGAMMMRLVEVVDTKHGVQSNGDRRYRCNRMVCSYIGDDGHEYRKSFEYKMDRFTPPQRGTSDKLNRLGRTIHNTQPVYDEVL